MRKYLCCGLSNRRVAHNAEEGTQERPANNVEIKTHIKFFTESMRGGITSETCYYYRNQELPSP